MRILFLTTIAVIIATSAAATTPAFAQACCYGPYTQHYNNAPGLYAPGLTGIPGVRDEPPSYGPRPVPYDPIPSQTPSYAQPPSYARPPSWSRSPYGQDDDN